MANTWKIVRHEWPMMAVLFVGLTARLLVAAFGHNYDFNSYLIVLNILDRGQNVYSGTSRYNYGPVWFNIIGIIYDLVSENQGAFRFALTVFLSFVDVGIFSIVWKRFGRVAASLFFLNPISVIITSYHNQFDNLAVLLGMISVELFADEFDKPLNWRKLSGSLILGLSLAVKHILFAFPLWLAVKQKGMAHKAVVLLLPAAVFVLGFLPYWSGGTQGIVRNVWLYESSQNEYFYRLFIPQVLRSIISAKTIWALLLIGFAFYFKKQNGFKSLLLYTSVLVWASPSIVNQYLAIPDAYLAAFFNPFHLAYVLVGAWQLVVDYDGLHVAAFQQYANRDIYYSAAIVLLLLGFIREVWGEQIRRIFARRSRN